MGYSREKTTRSSTRRFFSAVIMLCLSGTLVGSKAPTELERVQARGILQMISRNGPTTYYEGASGLTGFEYTLAKNFADQLGVELQIRDEENLSILLDSIGTPAGNFGAAGLTITLERQKKVLFGSPYLDVTQQLLYRAGEKRPATVEDLVGKDILVIANSAHAEKMRELQRQVPALRWRERNDLEMLDLVEMVHSGTVEYAIVDSNAYEINRHIYPKARVAFDFSGTQQLAWAFPRQRDSSLFDAAQAFFDRIKSDGTLEKIRAHYYDHINEVNTGGALVFARRLESRLPKWQEQLQSAAETFELDWKLLAAISYQESHWNSLAKSRTGVRGLMMLTQATAKDMGISNRIDPEQSIQGGAKYFKQILDRIPDRIQGPDRTWLALAAYNVGYGHLEDARILTEQNGGNPDKWSDVKEHLPLLAKRQYYRNTKHGYARGWEPVTYVKHIRNFYNILSWHQQLERRRLAATPPDSEDNDKPANAPFNLNRTVSFL